MSARRLDDEPDVDDVVDAIRDAAPPPIDLSRAPETPEKQTRRTRMSGTRRPHAQHAQRGRDGMERDQVSIEGDDGERVLVDVADMPGDAEPPTAAQMASYRYAVYRRSPVLARIVERLAAGDTWEQAAQEMGQGARAARRAVERSDAAQRYLRALQRLSVSKLVCTAQEKRQKLAAIIRDADPGLAMQAIKIDNTMAGHDAPQMVQIGLSVGGLIEEIRAAQAVQVLPAAAALTVAAPRDIL
jgi:hypothetical protein